MLPTFVDGRPNPEAVELDELIARPGSGRRATGASRPSMGGKRPAMPGSGSGSGRARCTVPRRVEVVERFEEERLLPAIYFVFSRAGCDEAVRQLPGRRVASDDARGASPRFAR